MNSYDSNLEDIRTKYYTSDYYLCNNKILGIIKTLESCMLYIHIHKGGDIYERRERKEKERQKERERSVS